MAYSGNNPFSAYPHEAPQYSQQPAVPHTNQYPLVTTSPRYAPQVPSMPYPTPPHAAVPPPYSSATPLPTSQPYPVVHQVPVPSVYPSAPPVQTPIPQATVAPVNVVTIPVHVPTPQIAPPAPVLHNLPTILPAQLPPWKPDQTVQYKGDDIAKRDVGEKDRGDNAEATPPPPYSAVVDGYKDAKYHEARVVRPPAKNTAATKTSGTINASNMPNLTDEDARAALLDLVNSTCCWGSKAAKKLEIKDIVGTSVHHYTLQSFTEARSYSYDIKPYKGGPIDAALSKPSPATWSIKCNPNKLWQNETSTLEVPHTQIAMVCHQCVGRGFNRCNRCLGRGKLRCGTCDGKKRIIIKVKSEEEGSEPEEKEVDCTHCKAVGRINCCRCKSVGCVVCSACDGYRKLLQYIKITVKYTDRKDDFITGGSGVADHLIQQVSGDTIFKQEADLVSSIENFCDGRVNGASRRLVQSHSTSWPSDKILRQWHRLRTVPVHNCLFEYKEKTGRFYVFGYERRVITNDYPHTCCCCRCDCCCTIL